MSTMSTNVPTEARGEINDLRQQLRDPQIEKDPLRKREVLRQVIALMTMGIDTSRLFTEMILACFTTDIVSKKLIYFYLISRSENNPELALLSINTLTKECSEESPLVRGLALRSLASLRLPQLFDFLIPLVNKGFIDTSPHVRKIACLCVLKIFRISPVEFYKQHFFDRMISMLRDNDPLVCSNALAVLMEVSRDGEKFSPISEGIFKITKPILYHLLNKLHTIPEWHQAQIINLILHYIPSNEEEMFDIMNLLEERLQSHNSDLILSICNVFLYLTQNYPTVHFQVFERLKIPLFTLISSCVNVEVSYVLLCHIKLLIQREPRVFHDSYKIFYCHYMEPVYIKTIKIEILSLLATEISAIFILEEFIAYAFEGNKALTYAAIEAIGHVALRLPVISNKVLHYFLLFLECELDYARGKSLVVMKDYLRKYHDINIIRPFLDTLITVYHHINFIDEESRIALVWILGELGEYIEDAPYILEGMCNEYLISETSEFCLQFLTSVVILFFKRPPEMQIILKKMFKIFMNDFSHADIHDQALLYYRLLRQNFKAANKIICGPKMEIKEFIEEQNVSLRDKLFEEFNTLSVIYYQSSDNFMTPLTELNDDDVDEEEEKEEEEEEEEKEKKEEDEDGTNIMNIGVGLWGANGLRAEGGQHPSAAALGDSFELSEEANIEPSEFQRRWSLLDNTATATMELKLRIVPEVRIFEEKLEDCGVFTLASGVQGDTQKYYAYAQEEGDNLTYFLLELLLETNGLVNITVKSDNPHMPLFLQLFRRIIEQF